MSKNLKFNIKNSQIKKALKIGGKSKDKAKAPVKKVKKTEEASAPKKEAATDAAVEATEEKKPQRVARARTRSAFAEGEEALQSTEEAAPAEELAAEEAAPAPVEETAAPVEAEAPAAADTPAETVADAPEAPEPVQPKAVAKPAEPKVEKPKKAAPPPPPKRPAGGIPRIASTRKPKPAPRQDQQRRTQRPAAGGGARLGPTGRHIRDLEPPKPKPKPSVQTRDNTRPGTAGGRGRAPGREMNLPPKEGAGDNRGQKGKAGRGGREYRDVKPSRRGQQPGAFDSRDRHGLRAGEEERWRKRRKPSKQHKAEMEALAVRPDKLAVRLPTTVKDLAIAMKLKASQLIQKLFMQGMVVTINDILDDETTVQLLGEEFNCAITIDTSEEERIRVTGQSIREEVDATDAELLMIRPPVVTFMGHVDHGKTSLLDAIRKSNVAGGEAGAITQHIGAFRVETSQGPVTFLDTPGHEAFSAMRARGAEVTDIVVLVVAGDEGLRQQTVEAIQHAKAANVTIMVAINKCDKPGFNTDDVYRQLSEQELLPEAWGGSTVTVNTSAVTGEGLEGLLEMLALQAEVMELRANPEGRARGSVLESQMQKGMGQVATILVQNGTLRKGDAVVFGPHWARVKTMLDASGNSLAEAGPATPVEITGMSGLPEAGDEFIVVPSEKDAKEIAEARMEEQRTLQLQRRKQVSLENLLQVAGDGEKKTLNLVVRADVQGSLEAFKSALEGIESDKATVNIIFSGIGAVSESDIQLAAASNAMVAGFHTQIESHAEMLIKETGVRVVNFDVIYHAVDEIKLIMAGLLDKIAREEDRGEAEVRMTFKASQIGTIAGCQVSEGMLSRNHKARLMRDGEKVWDGSIASIKRHQDDVKEVSKGFECGIVLDGYNDIKEGDIIQAYEIVYDTQEL